MIKLGGLTRVLTIPPLQVQSNTVVSAGGITDPTDISGLTLWLDANDITTLWTTSARSVQVASDGDPVGAWDDKSGNGYNFTQATSTKRGTYKTGIQNSKPIVRFDGTDDTLTHSTNVLNLTGATAATLYFVQYQAGSQTNNTTIFWNAAGQRFVCHATFSNVIYFDHPDSSGGRISVAQPSGWDDDFKLLELFRNSTTTSEIVVDSTVETSGSQTGTMSSNVGTFYLASATGGNPLNGDIAEVVIYDNALSAGDRANVESYLNDKWAVF